MGKTPQQASWSDLWAIAIAMASFSGVNALWTLLDLDNHSPVPYSLVVVLLAGSGVALAVLAWKLQTGRLTPKLVGIGWYGWRADRRLVGLLLTIYMACSFYRPEKDPVLAAAGISVPNWSDFWFWFVVVAPVSLAEVLVFMIIPVTLLERWLTDQGHHRAVVLMAAVVVSGVTFGLFHFTYPARWYAYVGINMLEMGFIALYFLYSRNFHLALLLHNSIASTGFNGAQYSADPLQQEHFKPELGYILFALIVPYFLIHVAEWYWQRYDGRKTLRRTSSGAEVDFASERTL